VGNKKDWDDLNAAISDKSLWTAPLRNLRRYYRAANEERVTVGPFLAENIQKLISHRITERSERVAVIALIVSIISLIVSLLVAWLQYWNKVVPS
jgi:hypothetical protein